MEGRENGLGRQRLRVGNPLQEGGDDVHRHGPAGAQLADGKLADVAPTLLALMGLPQPGEMSGQPLVSGRRAAE